MPARREIDVDPVRHHEGRVEADPELADELGALPPRSWIRSIKAWVPDRAMVPRASTISSRLMPMPLSSTVRRRLAASMSRVIRALGSSPRRAGLAIAS